MAAFQRILVPIDFSPFSRDALRYGSWLARSDNAVLDLLHVVQDLSPIAVGGEFGGTSIARLSQEFESTADEALSTALPQEWLKGLTVNRQTIVGSPWQRIVDFAGSNNVGLICLGTHGRGGFSRFILGSVAERVVQHSSCPVLVVRRHQRDGGDDKDLSPAVKRLLVPIDFSDFSANLIKEGCELARRLKADLHLLHVVEDNSPAMSEIAQANPAFQAYSQDLLHRGDRQLEEASRTCDLLPDTVHRHVEVGAPVQKINDYAKANFIDLIVVATHGRSGISHWMLGSVAERLVRSAYCPVLVFPQQDATLRNQPA